MKTQKEIEVRIAGINEAIEELNQELESIPVDKRRSSDVFADISQLYDRKKILEWVLNLS